MKTITGFLLFAWMLTPCLSLAGAKRFAKSNEPGPRTTALRKALEGSDRLEVRFTSDPVEKAVTILGAEKIGALAAIAVADEKLSASYSKAEQPGGEGDFCLIFYRGDRAVVRLNQFGQRFLEWNEGAWQGGSYLTSPAEAAWPRWFRENGFDGMERQYREWDEKAKLPQKRHDGFVSCFPAAAQKSFATLMKRYGEFQHATIANNDLEPDDKSALNRAARAFLSACGEPHAAGTAICRALGSLADPVFGDKTMFSYEDLTAPIAFAQLSPYIMPTVFETALSDPQAATGAARLFFREHYHDKIPWVMRDALAPKLLRVAVERDQPHFAINAINTAGDIAALPVAETLREVAAGKIAPATPSRLKMKDEEPDLRCHAALVLARRGDAQAKHLVEQLAALPNPTKSNLAAIAICRCFLGERDTIEPAFFDLDSWALGYAGIAALEKQGDKAALNVMITGATLHGAGLVQSEAVHAVQRMTGKTWYRAQPNENEVWYGKDIREWWQATQDTWVPLQGR